MTLKQLAQSTGLHPSTAHRILTALVHDRLVERIDQGQDLNAPAGTRIGALGADILTSTPERFADAVADWVRRRDQIA